MTTGTGGVGTDDVFTAIGLQENHAYTVLGAWTVKTVDDKFAYLIKVRNP